VVLKNQPIQYYLITCNSATFSYTLVNLGNSLVFIGNRTYAYLT